MTAYDLYQKPLRSHTFSDFPDAEKGEVVIANEGAQKPRAGAYPKNLDWNCSHIRNIQNTSFNARSFILF